MKTSNRNGSGRSHLSNQLGSCTWSPRGRTTRPEEGKPNWLRIMYRLDRRISAGDSGTAFAYPRDFNLKTTIEKEQVFDFLPEAPFVLGLALEPAEAKRLEERRIVGGPATHDDARRPDKGGRDSGPERKAAMVASLARRCSGNSGTGRTPGRIRPRGDCNGEALRRHRSNGTRAN
jgi:hypothetical protein